MKVSQKPIEGVKSLQTHELTIKIKGYLRSSGQ